MELKLDVKTLVLGIAIGVIATAVIGAGSADKADFGIAIPSTVPGESAAIVRTADDGLYVVNVRSGMAVRVLQAAIRDEPYDRREPRGKPFFLSGVSKTEKDTGY